jgi:hypothetical protein
MIDLSPTQEIVYTYLMAIKTIGNLFPLPLPETPAIS